MEIVYYALTLISLHGFYTAYPYLDNSIEKKYFQIAASTRCYKKNNQKTSLHIYQKNNKDRKIPPGSIFEDVFFVSLETVSQSAFDEITPELLYSVLNSELLVDEA